MSFPAYPKYKVSNVEWLRKIPNCWSTVPARRIFLQKRDPYQSGDEQLSATQKYGVVPQSKFMEDEDQKVTLALNGLASFKHVNKDDFVISLRSFQGGIEHSAYFGCVSPAYTILRPAVQIFPSYWKYLFKSKGFVEALQSVTEGIRDGKSISYEQFGKIGVPVLPIAEQLAIASFLDHETAKIDALIAEQQRLIELLKEKRQAVISHAVTKGLDPNVRMKDSGVEWLGEVPEHWEVVKLGRLCSDVADGPHFSPSYVDENSGGVAFLSARNLKVDKWDLDDVKYVSVADCNEFDKRIKPLVGDVLYTKGGTTGIARVVDLDFKFQVWVHLAVLKIKKDIVLPEYVAFALNSRGAYEQSQIYTRGATNQDLGLTRMIKILIALPPLKESQGIIRHIEVATTKLDQLIFESESAVKLLQERRTALISAAVTGQIDVRGFKPVAA
jgi:type I restriction enzyme S subunit